MGGGWVGGGVVLGGQGGCGRRIEVFGKIHKKKSGGGGVGRGGSGGEVGMMGGQGGCERTIEVFVKIQKRKLGEGVGGEGLGRGVGWGVRVDVNKELKFLGKFTKKSGVGRGGQVGGGGRVGGGQGGCERRIEVFVKIQKQNWGGEGVGGRVRGQGGCERRIEVFRKIHNWGRGSGGRGWVGGSGGGSGWM